MESKTKILVVDDSISLVDGLVKILEVSGYEVDPAYNGHDALRKLSAKSYDLVVCDIEMPSMNGLELLEYVRQDYDQIAFILMTGYLEHDYFIKAIQLGASDFLRKPVDTDHLLKSIQLQINKKKEEVDFLSVSNIVSLMDIKLSLPSHMFRQVDFIQIFTKFFTQNLNLGKTISSEMLLCMEEMLYNAFIHGTLRLNMQERTLGYEQYKELIYKKLQEKDIAAKKIHIRLSVNQVKHCIVFEVEDEGQGFDYKNWLNRIKVSDGIQLDEYGRGISILFHLTDKVSFSKGGRLVRVEKKFQNAS
jgi:YesN/AraC family two-component response regulator